MTQPRIRIFSDFCNSTHAKNAIDEIAYYKKPLHSLPVFITDDDDYTHVIIWNTAMPNIRKGIPKENVIGLAYEPYVYLKLTQKFIDYACKHISIYYIGDTTINGTIKLPLPFIEGNNYLTYNAKLLTLKPKTKIMSLMISQKLHQPGHKYRHMLANAILKTDLPVDIYGRGCQLNYYNKQDPRIKGGFEKYEMYDGYQFHICIENIQSNHYFSEKIINPLLTNTTPVYLGCHNIDSYFPNNVIQLTGKVDNDIQIITNIISNPEKYKKNIDTENIDKKVSLKHNIHLLFENI